MSFSVLSCMEVPVSVFSASHIRQKYAEKEDSLDNVSVCLGRTYHYAGECCMRKLADPGIMGN